MVQEPGWFPFNQQKRLIHLVTQSGDVMMDKYFDLQTDLSFEDLERISRAKTIAVDCEMGGLNPHRDLMYLVQISDSDNNINLIKTSSWGKAENLKKVLLNKNITKIFHFAIMDCAFLSRYMSIIVEGAYCTKIASKLASGAFEK